MNERRSSVRCEYHKYLNPCVVLLFISTRLSSYKFRGKLFPPFQILRLSSIFEAISVTMMHHLLRRLLKRLFL